MVGRPVAGEWQTDAGQRSSLRTSIKKVLAAIESGDGDKAKEAYKDAVPMIDRMAGKGIITSNKAARHKSRLNQHLRGM